MPDRGGYLARRVESDSSIAACRYDLVEEIEGALIDQLWSWCKTANRVPAWAPKCKRRPVAFDGRPAQEITLTMTTTALPEGP